MVLPSLGVAYLAAALEAAGHGVVLIDAFALDWTLEETVAAILKEDPGVVGISCLTIRATSAYALATALKAADKELLLVMGGWHVTALRDKVLAECPDVDVLIPGEAEATLREFVDRLSQNRSFADLPGLIYRGNSGEVIETPPAKIVRELDTIAPPDWDIFDRNLYRPLFSQGIKWPIAVLLSARGCPWGQCRFCHQNRSDRLPYRRHSPERVVAEFRHLVRDLGYLEIIFWDDNFCFNEGWLNTFCDLLDAEGLNSVPWTAQAHLRTATRAMFQRIRASGCYNLFIGIESGNQEMLDMMHKGTTLEQCRHGVQWAKEAGFETRCSYMLGLPAETREMVEETIRFACELDADYTQFIPFHVWPDTPFGEDALREGQYLGWSDDMHNLQYVPNTLSGSDELKALIKSAYRRYYLRPSYIAKTLWRLRKPVYFHRTWRGFLYFLGL